MSENNYSQPSVHLSPIVAMWDGLLEARIRLQKVLLLSNRLPQQEAMEDFKTAGGEPLGEALRESESNRLMVDDFLSKKTALGVCS